MKNVFRILLLVLTLSVIIISCSQDNETIPDIENVEDEKFQGRSARTNYAELDLIFSHLAQLPNIADMDEMQELTAIDVFTQQANIVFNTQDPTSSYNSALNGATSGYNQHEVAVMEDVDNILITYGFTPRAQSQLRTLRENLELSKSNRSVRPSIIESIKDMEYLTISPAFASYMNAKSSGAGFQQRGLFKCLYYFAKLVYSIIKCGIKGFEESGCVDVVYYTDLVIKECRPGFGGIYADPCEGSNNPCCGITCARGYTCFDGTCVRDTEDPGCAVLGCPPGYDCNGYECIPQ